MSLPEQPRPLGPEPYKPYSVGSGLMVLGGAVLLLPGICTVISMPFMLSVAFQDISIFVALALLWAACLLVAYGGIILMQRGRAQRLGRPD